MSEVREVALATFRGAYGRLSTLAAQALTDGYHREAVRLASLGKDGGQDRALCSLRAQRRNVNHALGAAVLAGNTRYDIIEVGLQAKLAVEQEWGVRIPIVSGAKEDA